MLDQGLTKAELAKKKEEAVKQLEEDLREDERRKTKAGTKIFNKFPKPNFSKKKTKKQGPCLYKWSTRSCRAWAATSGSGSSS